MPIFGQGINNFAPQGAQTLMGQGLGSVGAGATNTGFPGGGLFADKSPEERARLMALVSGGQGVQQNQEIFRQGGGMQSLMPQGQAAGGPQGTNGPPGLGTMGGSNGNLGTANGGATQRETDIANLYRQVLGREPDAAGLAHQVAQGGSIAELQSQFQNIANQPGYQAIQVNNGQVTGAEQARAQQMVQSAAANPVAQAQQQPINPNAAANIAQPGGQATGQQIGLSGSEAALQAGLGGALSALQQGQGQSNANYAQAQGALDPFAQGGAAAYGLQGAQSGAQGAAAQQAAFDNFTSSPGQTYLRDQAEQSLLRNQAAIGGIGGGNVRQALQQQATGLAAQDFDNQFNRLGSLSSLGANAAAGQANLFGQQAGANANFGATAANFASGAGRDLASGRTRAGEQIAGAIGSTTQGLSNLTNQQGAGLADIIGQGGGNLASILQNAGQMNAQQQNQLASMLANIAAGQGNQVAGQSGIPGTQQQTGILDSLGSAAGGAGTAIAAFSDIRLKENIVPQGTTPGGANVYSWDWTEEAKTIVGDQATIGVLAQEVLETNPDAVTMGEDGFYRVDYRKIA